MTYSTIPPAFDVLGLAPNDDPERMGELRAFDAAMLIEADAPAEIRHTAVLAIEGVVELFASWGMRGLVRDAKRKIKELS